MTEAQKEEEQLIKATFMFYERNKGGTPIEIFELPMLLEGKQNLVWLNAEELNYFGGRAHYQLIFKVLLISKFYSFFALFFIETVF